MGKFERFLTLWLGLCIIVGIGLGQAVPSVFHALGLRQWRKSIFRSPC
jgi:arsenite transporter